MTQPQQVSTETDDLDSFAAKVKASSLKLSTPDPSLNSALTPSGFQASQDLALAVTGAMRGMAQLKLGVSGTLMYKALVTGRAAQIITATDDASAEAMRVALKKAADGVPTVPPKKPGDVAGKPAPGQAT